MTRLRPARPAGRPTGRGGRTDAGRPAAPRPGSRRQQREALARRRARAGLLAACAFAALVLGTSLPLHTLLQQRSQTAAAAATVRHLAAENRVLAAQARALQDPSTVRAIAHSEFDYVMPGQKTYDVVPPSGTSGSSAGVVGVGHASLDQPVALPGSAASADALGASAVNGTLPPAAGRNAVGGRSTPAAGGGFVSRLLRSLEFWN